jgi:hypothetical protein
MMKGYADEMESFEKAIQNERERSNSKDVLKYEEIFPLVETLYRLPINGQKIREQVDILRISELNVLRKRETYVELPAKADLSKTMLGFKGFLSSK